MLELFDTIGDYIAAKPWIALGLAPVCLLVISIVIAFLERRIIRHLAHDAK